MALTLVAPTVIGRRVQRGTHRGDDAAVHRRVADQRAARDLAEAQALDGDGARAAEPAGDAPAEQQHQRERGAADEQRPAT